MHNMSKEQAISALHVNLTQELRRGLLVLVILSQLDEPRYGYALMDRLAARGLEVDQGTLYPLLRRLESQGLLDSEWNVEGPRPRRYYARNAAGSRLLELLRAEWQDLTGVMRGLLEE